MLRSACLPRATGHLVPSPTRPSRFSQHVAPPSRCAAHLRASVHGPRMEIDLVEWVATASEDIDAMLSSGRVPPRRALPPREKLAQLEMDAVGQIAL
ncbi:hypothetical protein PPH41_40305, partial [Burkholderia gladioli]|nr:hypothetical protein [Burkholderia gladioli]